MTKLRECPFCGGSAILTCTLKTWYVACDACRFELYWMDSDASGEDAIAAWNKRAPAPALQCNWIGCKRDANYCQEHPNRPAVRAGDPVVVVKAGELEKLRVDVARLEAEMKDMVLKTAANIRDEMRQGLDAALHSRVAIKLRLEALEKSEAARMDPVRKQARKEVIDAIRKVAHGFREFSAYQQLQDELTKLELCR